MQHFQVLRLSRYNCDIMPKTYKHLSAEERDILAVLKSKGHSIRQISKVLKRRPSTLSRELKRNAPPVYKGYYLAHRAQQRADKRKEYDMKLKVYVLILLLVSLCCASMAWAEVEVPEKLTKAAPIYKGAKVLQSMQFEEGVQATYEVSTDRKEVVKFYKDTMQKKGWKVVMEMNMENNSILNLAKDNLSLVVNTGVNQKGKTTVHLILQDK